MAIVYNPLNLNGVADLTNTINVIPNEWGLFNQLGIFNVERKSQKTIMVPRFETSENLVTDRNWDERNNMSTPEVRSYLTAKVPHFPLDTAIYPNDIDGVVDWNNVFAGIQLETVASTRARKMMKIRRDHARTLEYARAQLITTGTVYAPNGTLRQSYGATINWYTEFGVTRTELTMPLADETTDPLQTVEPIIAAVQDNLLSGDVADTFVAVCSPSFFNALISHPFVTDAYKYQNIINGGTNSRNVLVGRLTASEYGLSAAYRSFEYGGVLWIEYRGSFNGNPYIPAGDAYVFPVGGEAMFKTYFAPANRFDTMNQIAQEAYFFEKMGEWNDKFEIQTESNFLNAVLRPQALVRVSIEPETP